MRQVTVKVEGITPYSASRFFEEALEKGETKDAHERRRWREKVHADEDGRVYIPGVAFKMCLDVAVSKANEKIKGKGQQTYTGLFKSSVTAMSDMRLGIKIDDMKAISIYANADGKRGSGTRVTRWFPIIPNWGGMIEFGIFDDTIPPEKFEEFFTKAGLVAGVGRGRPETGCAVGNGRFKPLSFVWS
jgi:hypothetical protein